MTFLCTFQTVIVNFLVYLLKTFVGVSRKKSYLDTVRQLNYWSGQIIKVPVWSPNQSRPHRDLSSSIWIIFLKFFT
jgi:hypothetical protein